MEELEHSDKFGTLPQLIAPVTAQQKKRNNDYWDIRDELAVRIHVRPRLHKFTPNEKNTAPGSGQDEDPVFFRLGESRTTRVHFRSDPGKTVVIEDTWLHVTSNDQLGEEWTGETIFAYLPAAAPPTRKETMVVDPQDDVNRVRVTDVDHWTREGSTWTRHRAATRSSHGEPQLEPDGPDPRHLEDERVTTIRGSDGGATQINDNWRDPEMTQAATNEKDWTGTTVFTEKGHYPQVLMDDTTDQALAPRLLSAPQEPTDQERELHNLTHMPYRAWCPLCVKRKGRQDYRKQVYDKRLVI